MRIRRIKRISELKKEDLLLIVHFGKYSGLRFGGLPTHYQKWFLKNRIDSFYFPSEQNKIKEKLKQKEDKINSKKYQEYLNCLDYDLVFDSMEGSNKNIRFVDIIDYDCEECGRIITKEEKVCIYC